MSELKFLPTSRGGRSLIFDNFRFNLSYKRGDKTYWKCSNSRSRCKARIILKNDDSIEKAVVDNHNHEPEKRKIEALIFKEVVKERAKNEVSTPVPRIYK